MFKLLGGLLCKLMTCELSFNDPFSKYFSPFTRLDFIKTAIFIATPHLGVPVLKNKISRMIQRYLWGHNLHSKQIYHGMSSTVIGTLDPSR